jgi:CRP/FNR family cyclic AMP-dependent transcriptional regulator
MHGIIGKDALKAAGSTATEALGAFYLTEMIADLRRGTSFLERLTLEEVSTVRRASTIVTAAAGDTVFHQGDAHNGIYLIEAGRVRSFYAGPSGKEITLAYWTPGHFIGGPEVFGGGTHIWSAVAVEKSKLTYLPGHVIRGLVRTMPTFAECIIDGLVEKGRCYSALVQMLGTRSVTERLAQVLLILAEMDERAGQPAAVSRRITHDQLASIVGSTRQWVTTTLARFQKAGHIGVKRNAIVVLDAAALRGQY